MEKVPGPILYKILAYAELRSIGIASLLSMQIRRRLASSLSGCHYRMRKDLSVDPEDKSFDQ
jgi:hypothetical protein